MRYEKPDMEIEVFDIEDIVKTPLIEDGEEGNVIPGLPGTKI